MKRLLLPSFSNTIALVLLAFTVTTPASAFIGQLLEGDAKTKDESSDVASSLPEYKGVKHAVAVTTFENQSGWTGQAVLGEDLALMLDSALFDTGRFIVVDRQQIDTTLAEQDLQASGRAAESSQVAQTGQVRSARYLATGAVTRVNENTSGNDGGIGYRGIRIGGSSSSAELEVVVRLIDTSTGEVVANKRISGKAGGNSLSLGLNRGGVGAQVGGFARTPLGEAAQDCIAQAAIFIAQEMEDYEITANVVLARSPDQIVINRGENFGVEVGQVFVVRAEGEVLTDPATGEVLDIFEGEETGKVEVTRVSEKVSYAKLIEGELPNRGDSIIFAGM